MKQQYAPRWFSRRRVYEIFAAVLFVSMVASGPSANAGAGMIAGPRISVFVSAVDSAGKPVADLTAADLKVQLEADGAKIASLSHVGAPKQIIVLLDTSATWARGPQKMIWNTQCVSTLAEHLAGNSNFVVLGFSDQIVELYNGPANPVAIDKALKAAPRRGEAALFEILKFMGESVAQQSLGERTVMVVVSDGVDTASAASSKDVIRSLGLAGVPLYSLIVMDPAWNASNLSKLNARTKLLDISKATGGVSQSMNPGEVREATSRIAAMLAGRYRIEIETGVGLKSKTESKLLLGSQRAGVAMYHADHVYSR